MKIDRSILNRTIWFEDENQRIFDFGDRIPDKNEIAGMTYHTMFQTRTDAR